METLLHKLVRGLFKWRFSNAECRMVPAMRERDLKIRTRRFALEIIKFCERLPKDDTSRVLSRQLLRSGTSVGANYRAACRAKSKPAFISKMGDVLEEADESAYWVELLTDSGKVDPKVAAPVLAERLGDRNRTRVVHGFLPAGCRQRRRSLS